jgi:hypothetical protein
MRKVAQVGTVGTGVMVVYPDAEAGRWGMVVYGEAEGYSV